MISPILASLQEVLNASTEFVLLPNLAFLYVSVHVSVCAQVLGT